MTTEQKIFQAEKLLREIANEIFTNAFEKSETISELSLNITEELDRKIGKGSAINPIRNVVYRYVSELRDATIITLKK